MRRLRMSHASCPHCRKLAEKPFAPFCSKRCADIDLNRWFTGSYAIPAIELDDVDEGDFEEPSRE